MINESASVALGQQWAKFQFWSITSKWQETIIPTIARIASRATREPEATESCNCFWLKKLDQCLCNVFSTIFTVFPLSQHLKAILPFCVKINPDVVIPQ